jgi:hypothetical protein
LCLYGFGGLKQLGNIEGKVYTLNHIKVSNQSHKKKKTHLGGLKNFKKKKNQLHSLVCREWCILGVQLELLIMGLYKFNGPNFAAIFSHKHECFYEVEQSTMGCNHYYVYTFQFELWTMWSFQM